MKKKALIIFPDHWLSVAPSIISAIHVLNEKEYDVHVLSGAIHESFPTLPLLPQSVTISFVPIFSESRILSLFGRIHPYLLSSVSLVLKVSAFLVMTAKIVMLNRTSIEMIFGADMIGAIAAAFGKLFCSKARLIYWSLEIVLRNSIRNPIVLILFDIETRIIRHSSLIIVQDEDRAALLAKRGVNGPAPVALVPNSPGGKGLGDSFFLHDRLGIDRSKKIILQAGTISEVSMSLDVAAWSRRLDHAYIVVFHERQNIDINSLYIREILEVGSGHVRVSAQPVRLDELDHIFASSHIGIVFYSPQMGENIANIRGASGKLAYLLRNGVPIIVNDLPALRELVAVFECGKVVRNEHEFLQSISEIENNYAFFAQKAYKCFEEKYDFDRFFAESLQSLLG